MAPPTGPLNLDVDAISGICGSISIACWIVVFSPQIIENFRRGSANGLSVQFIIVWLLGDVFNILGAILQGVLPTMIILAIYYTIADIVLLAQLFYYRGITWRDEVVPPAPKPSAHNPSGARGEPNEHTGLLDVSHHHHQSLHTHERRGSDWSQLSPAVPHIPDMPTPPPPPPTRLQSVLFNIVAVIMVCAAGAAGWLASRGRPDVDEPLDGGGGGGGGGGGEEEVLHFSLWGQIFGYLCAVLYLGSRVPQLLLNWRRKSTEGVSMLFFLFACLGNLTYVLSIFAYDPVCRASKCAPGEARQIYGRYVLVNLSWLAGSLGTLFLDLGVFVQYFMYDRARGDDETIDDDESIDSDRWDQRPVLDRNNSDY